MTRPSAASTNGDRVARGGHDGRPVVGHQQVLDRVVDLAERDRGDDVVGRAQPEGDQPEGHDRAVVGAGHELLAGQVDGQRADARRGHGPDQRAGAQVVGPDLLPGRDVDPLAGPVVEHDVLATGLVGGGPDRHVQLARGADVVLAPQHQAAGHRVLGQVRVGPLVDVVVQPVAPALQELGRGPRVVDLVEVHLGGLGQAEGAQAQGRAEEHEQDPHVEAVEAAAALVAERRAAVGAHGQVVGPLAQPAGDADLAERPALAPGRQRDGGDRRRGARRHAAPRGRGGQRDPGRDRCRGSGAGSVRRDGLRPRRRRLGAGRLELADERLVGRAAQLQEGPHEGEGVGQGRGDDPDLGAHERPDAQPVGDRRVVRVERGQDDVHVRERRHGQHDVGDPPAPRDGEQDRPDGEEREPVALVDAGRDGEEGEGQDGQRDEDGQAVRAARDGPQDEADRGHQEDGADDDRRDDPEQGDARAAAARVGLDGIAHPDAGVGQAHPGVAGHDGPGVVGVDGQVRVAPAGHDDLVDEAGRHERERRRRLEDRQPEGQAQHDRGQEPGQAGGHDPPPVVGARLPGPHAGDDPGAGVGEAARGQRVVDRPQGPPDGQDRDERDEDAELGLDDRGDDRVDRGPLGLVAPHRAQGQEQEDDPERVDLAPHHAVEPGDRVEHGHERRAEGQPLAPAELADHRPDQPADGQVGQDRRDLDEVADAAQGDPDLPDQPQDVQVAGRVVVEEVALVEAEQAVPGEVIRPEAEGDEIGLEPGPREQVCDDETEGETEREDHQDRADGSLRPGRPRRCSCASLGPPGSGASHRDLRLLHERGRWIGA